MKELFRKRLSVPGIISGGWICFSGIVYVCMYMFVDEAIVFTGVYSYATRTWPTCGFALGKIFKKFWILLSSTTANLAKCVECYLENCLRYLRVVHLDENRSCFISLSPLALSTWISHFATPLEFTGWRTWDRCQKIVLFLPHFLFFYTAFSLLLFFSLSFSLFLICCKAPKNFFPSFNVTCHQLRGLGN